MNKEKLNDPDSIPELPRYTFRQVAIFDISYFGTFGSDPAVVSLLILICGLALGRFLRSTLGRSWPVALAVRTTMAGAGGNVGAVALLTVFSLVIARTFFPVIEVVPAFPIIDAQMERPRGWRGCSPFIETD